MPDLSRVRNRSAASVISAAHETLHILGILMNIAQDNGDRWVLRRMMEMAQLQIEIIRAVSTDIHGDPQ